MLLPNFFNCKNFFAGQQPMEQGSLPSLIQVGAPGNVTMSPGGNPKSSPFECVCLIF